MKYIIQKSTTITLALAVLMLSVAPLASAISVEAISATSPKKEHIALSVLWGNVDGVVQNASKMNFDGSISVSRGTVKLIDTIKFERHDAYRDRITSDANPVIWRSWVYNLYDGVEVDISAYISSKVTIKTMQGEMTLPMKTLIRAKDQIRFELGDGREIVVKVKHYVDPTPVPVDIIIGWGGPIDSVITNKDRVYTDTERVATAKRLLNVDSASVKPYILPNKVDFTGAVAVSGNGNMKLIEPLWFESNDKITRNVSNYVSWESTIAGHFDGVILKTSVGNPVASPIDDRAILAFKTEAGNGFNTEIGLKELYKKGIVRYNLKENGKVYTVVMVALPKPVCKTIFARFVEKCQITIEQVMPLKKVIENYNIKKVKAYPIRTVKTVKATKVDYSDMSAQLELILKKIHALQAQVINI